MGLTQITGGGSFTRQNINDINNNFNLVSGVDLWVNSQLGNNNDGTGSESAPYGTLGGLSRYLEPGIVIGISGVLFEQFTTPVGVNNVTLVGNQYTPRQATTSGVANGGGGTWLAPASPTTSLPLIRVQGQGWTLRNIYFNSTGITTNACVQPYTTGDPPTLADGAHLLIDNCILTGAKYGVFASGGTNFVRIQDSTIFGFGDSGDVAIAQTAGAGVGTLLQWTIDNCDFYGNANQIIMPFNKARITGNRIDSATVTISLSGGTASNYVVGNAFNIAAADFDPAGGVTGVTGDVWSNVLTDAIETGLPAN